MSIHGNFFDGYTSDFMQKTIVKIETANGKAPDPNGCVTRQDISNFLNKSNPGRDSYKAANNLLTDFSKLDVNQNGRGGNDGLICMGDLISYSTKQASPPAPGQNIQSILGPNATPTQRLADNLPNLNAGGAGSFGENMDLKGQGGITILGQNSTQTIDNSHGMKNLHAILQTHGSDKVNFVGSGWKETQGVTDKQSGVTGSLYQDASGNEILVAAAGTDGSAKIALNVGAPAAPNPPSTDMDVASLENTLLQISPITTMPDFPGTGFPGGSMRPSITKTRVDDYVNQLKNSGKTDQTTTTNLKNAEFIQQNFGILSSVQRYRPSPELDEEALYTIAAQDGNSQSISAKDLLLTVQNKPSIPPPIFHLP